MRMPSHGAFSSFICSAILTSSLIPASGDIRLAAAGSTAVQAAVQSTLNGMRAQGFSGDSGLALPAAAETPAARVMPATYQAISSNATLPPDLLAKMLTLLSVHGTEREVPAQFANALGLTAAGATWPDRQTSAEEVQTKTSHAYAVSRGTVQDVINTVHRNGALLAFRAKRDGTLVSALRYDLASKQMTMRDPAEAQADLDAEYAFWAENIDALIRQ